MHHTPLTLSAQPLRIPFRATVTHAAATRARSASVWVTAQRGEQLGLGEGCPRDYVTGETPATCTAFLGRWLPLLPARCGDPDALIAFQQQEEALLDANPAAWCAVELALWDLFARERDQPVEALLGLPAPAGEWRYTAVLAEPDLDANRARLEQYLALGLTDVKVKLTGDLGADGALLQALYEGARRHGALAPRLRLDANNLWAGRAEVAAAHLDALRPLIQGELLGVEEPLGAGDAAGLAWLSARLGAPIILDESLRRAAELAPFAAAGGAWIANLKVSKVGGVWRALQLLRALAPLGWPVIIGAHVGESSVLTRAAMLVARAAGDRLLGQEGAFGDALLTYDMTAPSLRFGPRGELCAQRAGFGPRGWGLSPSSPPP
jgi:L-alanine-DL-glutamate epimerase-like enolase superfamily enzyme